MRAELTERDGALTEASTLLEASSAELAEAAKALEAAKAEAATATRGVTAREREARRGSARSWRPRAASAMTRRPSWPACARPPRPTRRTSPS